MKQFCRSVLATMLAVLLLLSSIPTIAFAADGTESLIGWDGTVADGFESGDGTAEAPYTIVNGAQLAYFAACVNRGDEFLDKHVVLGADILLNDVTDWEQWGKEDEQGFVTAPANHWTPIGGSSYYDFNGTFDGNGYTIYGLYHRSYSSYAGLFARAENAVLRNIRLECSAVIGLGSSYNAIGGICGYAYNTTLSGCVNGAAVTGSVDYAGIGGVCGSAHSSTVTDCENSGTVQGGGVYADVGGVCGALHETSVTGCLNRGEIRGESTRIDVGGVVGQSYNRSVTACENRGAIYVDGVYAYGGGIVADASGVTVRECVNSGSLDGGVEGEVGGISGYIDGETSIAVCRNSGDLNGASLMGGIAAVMTAGSSVSDCYNVGSLTNTGDYVSVGGIVGDVDSTTCTVSMCYAVGDVQMAAETRFGGVVGEVDADDSVQACYYADTLPSTNSYGTALSAAQLQSRDSFVGWNFHSLWELGFDEDYLYPTLRAFGSKEYTYRVVLKNGDTVLSSLEYQAGETVDLTPPESTTLEFAYWRSEDLRQFDPSQTVTASEDMTLTAIWMPKRTSETAWDGSVDYEWEGSGTQADPYLISTPAELAGISTDHPDWHDWYTDTYFRLTADLCMNDGGALFSDTVVGRHAWTPIGDENHVFFSHFDGNGHTVSGLYVYTDSDKVGLFGHMNEGSVTDLTLEMSYIRGGRDVGGIVGYTYGGTFKGCTSRATVYGENYVGGILGNSSETELSNCVNYGTVRGKMNEIGGIAGNGDATLCINYGNVSGNNYVGGIAGNGDATRCVNYGDVSGAEYVGGIVGYGDATDSYSTGKVSGTGYVGGAIGYGNTVRCYTVGTVLCDGYAGPLQSGGSATDSYYLENGFPSNDRGTALSATQMSAAASFEGWNFRSVWELGYDSDYAYPTLRDLGSRSYSYRVVLKDGDTTLSETIYQGGAVLDLTPPASSEYDFAYWRREDIGKVYPDETITACEDQVLTAVWAVRRTTETSWDGTVDTEWAGSGTAKDPYQITSAAELAGVSAANAESYGWQSRDTYFLLTADILLNDGGEQFSERVVGKHDWAPIGNSRYPFGGHFDGNGHTVSGVSVYTGDNKVGLFGTVRGTVKNLTVADSYICGNSYVGAVAGATDGGTLTACTSDSVVYGGRYVGGVLGNGTASDCVNLGTVNGREEVGGIAGSGAVSTSYNAGVVNGTDYVGGVIGYTYDPVTACYNRGTVNGVEQVGGAVGFVYGTVSACYNLGKVIGEYDVGGVVGSTHGEVVNCYNQGTIRGTEIVGGVCGYSYSAISGCYNGGIVRGDENIGGVCGYSYDAVINCYNYGTVEGDRYVGGIASHADIETGYNAGEVSGNDTVGAVVGYADSVTDCYYLDTSAVGDDYATALSAEAMTDAASFVGFDFTQYWTVDPTAVYPYPTLTGVPHRVFYTVTYKDTDGTVLRTEQVEEGDTPSYYAPYELLLIDDDAVYRFVGWDTTVTETQSDLVITAVRSKTDKLVLEPIRLSMTVDYGYSGDNLQVDAESLLRRVICTMTTGYRVMSDVTWDLSAYDPEAVGDCVLTGALALLDSPYYKWADGASLTLTVTVAAPKDESHVFRADDLVYEVLADGTVAVTGYTGSAQRIVLPSTVGGKTVTAIADGAFENHTSLLSVALPVTVTTIGDHAFAGCTSLCEVALPEGLQTIGARAFYGAALTTVTCSDAVTSIGDYAFGFYGETPTATTGFVLCGYADSTAADYAAVHGFGYVVTVRTVDEDTAVEAVLQENVTLAVVQVTGGEHFEAATQILENSDGVVMYDMTIYNTDSVAVQPDSMITFRIPVPESFEASDCRIYRVNDDGSFKDMNAAIDGGQLVFQTSHLSYYAIVDGGEQVMVGDIDGNGIINTMDALRLYAAMSGIGTLSPAALAAADINHDGDINTMDALLLYKTASGR